MITDKVKDNIAQLSVKPICDKLSERATDIVVENFCKPHCGGEPEGEFCADARGVYRRFLRQLCELYSSHN